MPLAIFRAISSESISRNAVGMIVAVQLALMNDDPIDDDVDAVFLRFGQLDWLVEIGDDAVDPHPYESLPPDLVEYALVLALAVAHDRGQNHQASAVRQRQKLIGHLLDRLLSDRTSAVLDSAGVQFVRIAVA